MSRMFVELLARYPLLDNGWVSFGVLPVLAFIVGYLGTAIPLEFILPLVPDAQTITYKKDKGKGRRVMISETRARIPARTQVGPSAALLFGPGAILNGVFSAFVLPLFLSPLSTPLPDVAAIFISYCAMHIVGDLVRIRISPSQLDRGHDGRCRRDSTGATEFSTRSRRCGNCMRCTTDSRRPRRWGPSS